jgi:hypothetical protein
VQGETIIDCLPLWTREDIQTGRPDSDEWVDRFDHYFAKDDIDKQLADHAAEAAGLALHQADESETWAVDVLRDAHGMWWVIDAQVAAA